LIIDFIVGAWLGLLEFLSIYFEWQKSFERRQLEIVLIVLFMVTVMTQIFLFLKQAVKVVAVGFIPKRKSMKQKRNAKT